jgi:hypothetical protein
MAHTSLAPNEAIAIDDLPDSSSSQTTCVGWSSHLTRPNLLFNDSAQRLDDVREFCCIWHQLLNVQIHPFIPFDWLGKKCVGIDDFLLSFLFSFPPLEDDAVFHLGSVSFQQQQE